MPTYDFQCSEWDCGRRYERFYSFADFHREEICPDCGSLAEVVISPPRIQGSSLRHEAFFDHSLGAVVSSQKEREELAKKIGEKEGRNIVFADPNDTNALGVNDDGLDATRRRKRDTGQETSTRKHL